MVRLFARPRPTWRTWLKAARVHQWVKNLLVFVPLIASHRVFELTLVAAAVAAFVAHSLSASAVYLINDLLDLAADRQHPTKRKRPFAAGDLQASWGLVAAAALLVAGTGVAVGFASPAVAVMVLAHVIASLFYSIVLKTVPILDVFALASLYLLRIFTGGVSTGIQISGWLFSFALLLFLSLALCKRVSELNRLRNSQSTRVAGRDYRTSDLEDLKLLGTNAGMLSSLVLALYINSAQVVAFTPGRTYSGRCFPSSCSGSAGFGC